MQPESHAALEWDAQGQPLSSQFGDVYFSKDNGLEESRQVFLKHNRLAERFAELAPGAAFCIGETGFGSGLNFLCAWQLFEQNAPADACLHFVSVERFPLKQADLERALALWPELNEYSQALIAQYRGICPGFQRLSLAAGRVQLTLLIGDACEQLAQLDAHVDAWFLDGFAPAKNPQMWSPKLFAELARLSKPQASLATFTCAGQVRRDLSEAGFVLTKEPGYGRKREMLVGQFTGAVRAEPYKPWFARAFKASERCAVVIGGGLAGCATAASLAQRGWQVTLIERRAQLAEECSGNPQGALYLKLSAYGTPLTSLVLAGFGRTRRLAEQLNEGDWQGCGLLQMAYDEAEQGRQVELVGAFSEQVLRPVDAQEASALAGIELPMGGLFYPESGWIHPPALCAKLVDHPRITRLHCQEVLDIRHEQGQWQAFSGQQLLAQAPVIVLAGAAEVQRFAPCAQLTFKRIRGQLSRLPMTPVSQQLRTVLCAEGCLMPARQGAHTLGSSFDLKSQDEALSVAEHQSNLQRLAQMAPQLAEQAPAAEQLEGRVAFRCSTPDYLPLIGPLADREALRARYAVLAKDSRKVPAGPCPWLEGLYLNTGHGARGLISAPLSGELLAAWLSDEPLPVPRDLAEACHPNRFWIRELIRRQ